MATIITKNSSTASSVPLNTQLVQGELAVNVTDKRLFTENASGTVVELGTNPSTLVTSNTFLAFGRGNTEDMRLTSTGLGIGTSLPNEKLVVNGAVRSSSNAAAVTASAGAVMDYYSGMARFFATDGSAVGQMNLDKAGNLGLGVTPSTYSQGKAIDINTNMGAWASGSGAIWSYNTYFNSGYKYKTSDVAAMYVQGSQHQWHVAASGTAGNAISFTQAMTLDASGTLGIGVTSPAWKLDIDGIIASRSGSLSGLRFQTAANGYNGFVLYETSSNSIIVNNYNAGPITFKTNDTERARITSGGDLLVGTTTAGAGWGAGGKLTVDMGSSYTVLKSTNGAGSPELLCWSATGTSDNLFITFATETGGTTRGTIDYNRAVGLTRYNTTSDYRAKTVKGPVDNPLQRVMQLKPCTGRMNEATEDIDFFVAHELQSIVPSAVSGEKDAVNEDGTPKYQLVDKSALIPLLTAAIQELNAKVESLTAELNTLKGN